MWVVGGERMRVIVCAQVSVGTNKSECLSVWMFTGEVLSSTAGSGRLNFLFQWLQLVLIRLRCWSSKVLFLSTRVAWAKAHCNYKIQDWWWWYRVRFVVLPTDKGGTLYNAGTCTAMHSNAQHAQQIRSIDCGINSNKQWWIEGKAEICNWEGKVASQERGT